MKRLVFAALGLLVSLVSMAQGDFSAYSKSHSFLELQGGMQWTATDAKIDKLLMPVGAVSLGHYFTPEVGARLHVSAPKAKGRFEGLDKDYEWNYIMGNADVLVNLTNLFSSNKNHPLNLIAVAGAGLTKYGKHDELATLAAAMPNEVAQRVVTSKVKEWSNGCRLGLRLETNMNKPLGLSLEFDANNLHDEFNGKLNGKDDWMFSGMLGLSLRFGHAKAKAPERRPDPVPEPVVIPQPQPQPAPQPVVVEKPKPQPKAVVKTEKLHEEIFYLICMSDPEENGTAQLRRVAAFMKKHADAKINVVGYADKGTGNAELNQMYSERRAHECVNELVNKYGIDASRIIVTAKGDREQPFAENDKNRCVIIDGTAQYTVYE